MKAEPHRLATVKEQILICYLGFGWEEVHHPWSKNNTPFTSVQCLNHFIDVALPLDNKYDIPSEPLVKLPQPPDLPLLGTTSHLASDYKVDVTEFKE
eukprot:12542178-Ditylum_brightwellii.AAC.1